MSKISEIPMSDVWLFNTISFVSGLPWHPVKGVSRERSGKAAVDIRTVRLEWRRSHN